MKPKMNTGRKKKIPCESEMIETAFNNLELKMKKHGMLAKIDFHSFSLGWRFGTGKITL